MFVIRKLKVFEAFAGVGSQRMALRNLGIPHEVVAISEIDKYAIQSYNAIHGETLNLGDISKIDVKDIPDHDLFTYSFPCQDISTAGLKEGLEKDSSTKSSLLWECQKIIDGKKPKYLLMENVKNLVSKKHKRNFDLWCTWLEKQGYKNYWNILDAKDFNVPQSRERIFMISVSKDLKFDFTFPEKQRLDKNLKDYLDDKIDDKYYKIKPSVQKNLDLLINNIMECKKDIFVPTQKQVSSGRQDNLIGINVTPCLRVNGYSLILDKNKKIRKLSPLEYWKLMGFISEDFYKAKNCEISDTQLYKQAGNSIVVNVLEAIFKSLFQEYII